MNNHGFFRNIKRWERASSTDDYLLLKYQSNGEFKEQYPFEFSLHISYKLISNKLLIKFKIINISSTNMYYGFGWHPAFNFNPASSKITFNKEQEIKKVPINGFLNKGLKTIHRKEFNVKELDFSNSESYAILNAKDLSQVTIKDDRKEVLLNTKGYDNIVFWTINNNASFVCIEPWMSHQDFGDGQEFSLDKKWSIKTLASNKEIEYNLEIVIKN